MAPGIQSAAGNNDGGIARRLNILKSSKNALNGPQGGMLEKNQDENAGEAGGGFQAPQALNLQRSLLRNTTGGLLGGKGGGIAGAAENAAEQAAMKVVQAVSKAIMRLVIQVFAAVGGTVLSMIFVVVIILLGIYSWYKLITDIIPQLVKTI